MIGALLALMVVTVPAVIAADHSKVKTVASGDPTVVSWVIPSTGAGGIAMNVAPNSRYGSISGASWINTNGQATCGQGCGTTTIYTTTFELPVTVPDSVSIRVEVLADNAAVAIELNGYSIGAQDDGDIYANYQTVSTYTPDLEPGAFNSGTNTLTIENRDYGVVDGIAFKATMTYTPVPIDVNFVTPAVKTADGSTAAAIISCNVTPAATDLACAPAAGATADFDTAAAGSGKVVTAALADFNLTGPLVDEYTQRSVTSTTARIRPAGIDVINPATGQRGSVAFSAQPIDTQANTPIYSICVPTTSGTVPSGTPPCKAVGATGSSPVTVTATDAFGNLAGPGSPGADATNAPITITIKETGQAATLGTAATSIGVAAFGDSLVIATTRSSTTLLASATATVNTTSNPFRVVSDLAACDGTTCDSLANIGGTGFVQKSYGRIKTTDDFFVPGTQNVILTTQFSSFEKGQCATPGKSLGQTSEVRVDGTGVTPTSPAFSVTLIYPKETIKKAGLTARNADSYDVCLGATWLNTGDPVAWQAKNLATGALQPSKVDPTNPKLYWGWVPMCSAIQASNLTADQKAQNPCVTLRTKQAATLKAELVTKQGMTNAEFNALGARDSDVMIVVSKPWPWDGKFGTGLR